MFLDIEWPRIQGTRVPKCGKTIFWEDPLQDLSERESYELNEKDTDGNGRILVDNKHRNPKQLWRPRTSQHHNGVEDRYDEGKTQAKKPTTQGK